MCHLRLTIPTPKKEDTEYVEGIKDGALAGLYQQREVNLYQASGYFDFMHRAAVYRSSRPPPGVDSKLSSRSASTRRFFKARHRQPFRSCTPELNLGGAFAR
jgi:glutaminyl-tRNA synthetase